ncbi:MAG: TetR/AcrR family transcriptional regulator [Aigarchaeota archaeon]|nr:TetR/AcrR family transcriptional regulator [Aigarchaeota archaeon]MCX8193521.1 TetR/AcrR family transcriptional regulator [Nitrososphaeria archaeon]MDW7986824.1 TetR/AcrR family transcriptional regulator [Nitrososphaerota archaeon]
MLTTRENIIKAAIELFSTRSYSDVSIDDIASRAKVSKGAVFHYFSSKIDLAEAVMKHILKTIENRLEEIFSSNLDNREKLGKFIDLALDFVELKKNSLKSLDFVSEICKKLVENNRYGFVEDFYIKIESRISNILKETDVMKTNVRAALFMIILNGLIHYTFFYPKPLRREFVEELKNEVVEVMLK